MAYDPMQGFQIGQAVGKAKGSAYGSTAKHLSDLEIERDKNRTKTSPLELMMIKQSMPQPDTGVYSWNPLSGKLEQEASVPKGSIVRNTLGEEDLIRKAEIQRESQVVAKTMDVGGKLGTAVKRLNLINNQLNEALPAVSKNPFIQRIAGPAAVIGAKTGLMPNPKLMALKKNIRPIGIQMIRAFGEVGNLTETEQTSAIDTVQNEGLTTEERLDSVRQFAEFALAGARPEAIEFMRKDPGIMEIIKDLNINIGSNAQIPASDPRELYNQFREQGLSKEEAKAKAGLK